MTADPFQWAREGAAARLLSLLNAEGEARFVGGCVRDSLLGKPPGGQTGTDIDIAATLLPENTQQVLEAAGLRVIPTGLDHGTVTAILDGEPFEITTLRRDVASDGRHAEVAYTEDWQADAARRDFTINALYLSTDGQVTDFFNGQVDLKQGQVRFIGSPDDRIQEDYLRILRFLRFSARYSQNLDPMGWQACTRLMDGLGQLSKERIWQEVARLFPANKAPMAISAAASSGLLERIIPVQANLDQFGKVHQSTEANLSAALGLTALWPEADRQTLINAFKPSNETLDQVETIRLAAHMWRDQKAEIEILYRAGRIAAIEGYHLSQAQLGRLSDPSRLQLLNETDMPVLPIRGKDLIDLGVPKGPAVSQIQKKFEDSWLQAGCPTDAEQIDLLLQQFLPKAP